MLIIIYIVYILCLTVKNISECFFAVKVEVVVVPEKSLSSSFQPSLRPMDKIRNIILHIQSNLRGSYSHNQQT
jgi:hypothetical protein